MIKPKWLQEWQAEKAEIFRLEGFPNRKTEDWKYTPLGLIAENTFRRDSPCHPERSRGISSNSLGACGRRSLDYARDDNEAHLYLIALLDGKLSREHSHFPDENQVSITTWSDQYAADPEWLKAAFTEFSSAKSTPFTNLNHANFDDGLLIRVNEDCILDKPIQLLYINSNHEELVEQHLHSLIFLGKNTRVTFLETHEDHNSKSTFHNNVTNIFSDENSILDYFKLSPENDKALQISSMAFSQEKNSVVNAYHFGLGGRLVRDDLHFNLKNTGASCGLYGFYALNGAETYDCHSRIDHSSSHTNSQQIYKGIVDGKARGVFNGKIVVHKGLNKISAKQKNHNLLLAKTAEMNTKPELEIYSEDVSCSHGATIGELDSKALFYLRSRGIPEEEAKQVLTHAFAVEILEKLPKRKMGLADEPRDDKSPCRHPATGSRDPSSCISEYLYKRIMQKLTRAEILGESGG